MRERSLYYDRAGQPISLERWGELFTPRPRPGRSRPRRCGGSPCCWATVWLGLDHGFGYGPPLIFETMTFSKLPDDDDDQDQWRYGTEDAARAGHEAVCAKLRAKYLATDPGVDHEDAGGDREHHGDDQEPERH